MNWFAVELHCHTVHSDGHFTVDSLAAAAKRHELDGIALTDHNTVSGWAELTERNDPDSIAILKGLEWTTFFGHLLVMDCPVIVDWRNVLPDNIDEKISEIRSFGGIAGIAHPFELGSPMCTGCYWDYRVQKWENISFIEVWSGCFPAVRMLNRRAVELWNSLLDKGYHIAATYGRDWHRETDETVPYACTYIGTTRGALTAEDIKHALLSGRTAVTMGPKFVMDARQENTLLPLGSSIKCGKAVFEFSVDSHARENKWKYFEIEVQTVRLVGNQGKVISELLFENRVCQVEVSAKPGWYRGELWGTAMGQSCCLAMTSPVYCDV